MDGEVSISFLVWCWRDRLSGTTQLRVVSVGTGEEIQLSEGSFLLRVSTEGEKAIIRTLIRHISSGREAYIQGGENLFAFVNDCLLQQEKPDDTT
jgi:hypothetical protein